MGRLALTAFLLLVASQFLYNFRAALRNRAKVLESTPNREAANQFWWFWTIWNGLSLGFECLAIVLTWISIRYAVAAALAPLAVFGCIFVRRVFLRRAEKSKKPE